MTPTDEEIIKAYRVIEPLNPLLIIIDHLRSEVATSRRLVMDIYNGKGIWLPEAIIKRINDEVLK